LRFVDVLTAGERRRRFNGVDADDGLAQALLVGADFGGQIRERGFVTQRHAQLLARRFELAPDAADAARPRVLAQRVDHRPANPALGERLELDAARRVEALRRIDEANDAVLDQIAQINRVRHRRRHAPRERLHKGQACLDARVVRLTGGLFDVHALGLRCTGRSESGSCVAVAVPLLWQPQCQSCAVVRRSV